MDNHPDLFWKQETRPWDIMWLFTSTVQDICHVIEQPETDTTSVFK